jgi:hypothetical protein
VVTDGGEEARKPRRIGAVRLINEAQRLESDTLKAKIGRHLTAHQGTQPGQCLPRHLKISLIIIRKAYNLERSPQVFAA